MSQNINTKQLMKTFDEIKNTDNDIEWRSARDFQHVLEYTEWRNFIWVIQKAKNSCKNSNWAISDHFVDINKQIIVGKWAIQNIPDIMLSRYACYLIAQNWNSQKPNIAFAQAYFATQTRKQEQLELYMQEYERLLSRQKLKITETEFQNLAYERWVDGAWISRIRSKWDTILFGGKTTKDMKKIYWIKNWPLADHLPQVTIKAKDLATEVTNHKMKNGAIIWEDNITIEHMKNNKWVRDYLLESWIKPENLPPAEDLKKIERKHKRTEKILSDWKLKQ